MCMKCRTVLKFSDSFARFLDQEDTQESMNIKHQIFEMTHQAETIMLHEDDCCIQVCREPLGIILNAFEKELPENRTKNTEVV
jgi:hypothetical protein